MTTQVERTGLDVDAVRDHFPALSRTRDGLPVAFLDGPGGTQVPRACIDGMVRYLESSNANQGGAFDASVETDALLAEAHAATADFLGAHHSGEVIFGPNMTTLTFALSRAVGRELGEGDEVVVTRLDHDANVAPWLAMAEDRGATVRWIDVRPEDCTLDLGGLESLIGERTRLVAFGLASNAVGTVNDAGRLIEMAHAYGAWAFVDAVHAAPHLPIDVAPLRADFLACSPYKFFGPHLGVLYGRADLLDRLGAYRVRPAGDGLPGKWEVGTQSHEALAGLLGTYDYLASLGRAYGGGSRDDGRRGALRAAMSAIRGYERTLIGPFLEGLAAVRGLRVYGITGAARVDERVPTVAFTLEGRQPRQVAAHLAERGISVWDGDYYAVELVRGLGLDRSGGMVRVGLVHYNTLGEVERLVAALEEIAPPS
ncbi:MAG TPA: cysteine desulfurase-like protein [Candidatus Limnocylindria bacterium]|nr:cysteine desulfurase-like protein [Candidatus Limnocylindria bacterium]